MRFPRSPMLAKRSIYNANKMLPLNACPYATWLHLSKTEVLAACSDRSV